MNKDNFSNSPFETSEEKKGRQDIMPTSPLEIYQIGEDYFFGRNGKQQDFTKASEWYRMAAEQGYNIAQHNLGSMYENGRGVPQSNKEAAKWFLKAANQGDEDAWEILGELDLSD